MMGLTTKVCSKCKEEKGLAFFSKDNKRKNGVSSICKLCRNMRHKERMKNKGYREKNKARKAEFYKKNKENELNKGAIWRKNNPEKIKELSIAYKKSNVEKIKQYSNSQIKLMSDGYIRGQLKLTKYQATQELIKQKREQLQTTRLLMNLDNAIKQRIKEQGS